MKYAIVDTEGSGLYDFKKPANAAGQPRVAAVGLILVNENLEVESSESWLIRPDGWIFDDNSEAAKINGLTQERLMAEGVDVRIPLRAYGAAIDERRPVVGFNVSHDLKALRSEMRYVGFPDRFMQTRSICAMQACRQLVDARGATGKKKAPRLEEACIHFDIEPEQIHTAIGGAERALKILRIVRDRVGMPAYSDPYDKQSKSV